jgi:hypothetical protein
MILHSIKRERELRLQQRIPYLWFIRGIFYFWLNSIRNTIIILFTNVFTY